VPAPFAWERSRSSHVNVGEKVSQGKRLLTMVAGLSPHGFWRTALPKKPGVGRGHHRERQRVRGSRRGREGARVKKKHIDRIEGGERAGERIEDRGVRWEVSTDTEQGYERKDVRRIRNQVHKKRKNMNKIAY